MSVLSDVLAESAAVPHDQVEHLQRLVGEWQLLSDLSFADLVLWVPTANGLLCAAQVRPTTGPTAHQDDLVGKYLTDPAQQVFQAALSEGRIVLQADTDWSQGEPIRREAVPVRFKGEVIAVLSKDANLKSARSPSQLELAYLQSAGDLHQMVVDGTFPPAGQTPEPQSGPRAGDGLLRLDPGGVVIYASPNALSAYRRLGVTGNLIETELALLTKSLVNDPFEAEEIAARITQALEGQAPLRMEVEAHGATVLFRALPLQPRGESLGALVLLRDVTEVRRRDRQLMSKDATIREIHHRVKNNLQTVAALLRLQARRVEVPQARTALEESVRRVSSIALVHETLSLALDERVHFDGIMDRLLAMIGEVSAAELAITLRREGSFGELSAHIATPLAMVLTELTQNAVEHAFVAQSSGEVQVLARRIGKWLEVDVIDNGAGLPPGFSLADSNRLGLQIVRTLMDAELRGEITINSGAQQGTEAKLRIPLIART